MKSIGLNNALYMYKFANRSTWF